MWGIHSQLKTVSPRPHTGRDFKHSAYDDRFTRLPVIGVVCLLKWVCIYVSHRLALVAH